MTPKSLYAKPVGKKVSGTLTLGSGTCSCVGASMLRTTIVPNAGFFVPQYFAFGARVTCDVVLKDFNV